MLLRIALFFVVAFLALLVVGAEDYYKVCKVYIMRFILLPLSQFQVHWLTKLRSYWVLRRMPQSARSRKHTEI